MMVESWTMMLSSISAGTLPTGLIARYSGFLCSPEGRSSQVVSHLSPFSKRAMRVLRAYGHGL